MSSGKILPRRQAVPVLYTRGTHYEVGFDMVSPRTPPTKTLPTFKNFSSPCEWVTTAAFLKSFTLLLELYFGEVWANFF